MHRLDSYCCPHTSHSLPLYVGGSTVYANLGSEQQAIRHCCAHVRLLFVALLLLTLFVKLFTPSAAKFSLLLALLAKTFRGGSENISKTLTRFISLCFCMDSLTSAVPFTLPQQLSIAPAFSFITWGDHARTLQPATVSRRNHPKENKGGNENIEKKKIPEPNRKYTIAHVKISKKKDFSV